MPISLNRRALALVEAMVEEAEALGVAAARGASGERLIDCGAGAPGGLEAGRLMAEIAMGGLSEVTLRCADPTSRWAWSVAVRASRPPLACLASQYAGWSLTRDGFSAMGSGPARALARREAVVQEIGHEERAEGAVLLLETDRPPPAEIVAEIAAACRLPPASLTVLFAPVTSLAASVQVAARTVEVAVHKARLLDFPLARIVDGLGACPLAPPHPDMAEAMGRTNDAIIYGGQVHLFVAGPEAEARRLAEALPSHTARAYGRLFGAVFESVGRDFYATEPGFFSPAVAVVTALDSGATFRAGALNPALVAASFG